MPGLTVANALMQQRKSKGSNTTGRNEDISVDDKAKKLGIDMRKFKQLFSCLLVFGYLGQIMHSHIDCSF